MVVAAAAPECVVAHGAISPGILTAPGAISVVARFVVVKPVVAILFGAGVTVKGGRVRNKCVSTQVDQEWPLFYHLITTGPHSCIWK